MLLTQSASLVQSFDAGKKSPRIVDYHATTRTLIRSGCDLEISSDYLKGLVPRLPSHPWLAQIEKPIWEYLQRALVDCAIFLCDQGLKVDSFRPLDFLLLWKWITTPGIHSSVLESTLKESTHTVFLECLLEVDYFSIGREDGVWQGVDIFKVNQRSAKFAVHFLYLACILIHFGCADTSASTMLGFRPEWWNEWMIVLEHCGFGDKKAPQKEKKPRFLGNGESTAVDTDDLVQDSGSVTRRRTAAGDRLEDEDLDS